MKPLALLIFPPVYDFALYDLYLKPYALLRLGLWLKQGGYNPRFVNYLDYTDAYSLTVLKKPRRRADGSGKFFRQPAEKPASLRDVPRYYYRYGVVQEAIEAVYAQLQPDIILISSLMTYWYPGVAEAAQTARRFFKTTPLVIGGIYATLCPEHCRNTILCDQVVSGPALPRLKEILGSYSLPIPPGDLTEEFLGDKALLGEAALLRLNTGCPYRCRYCASPLLHEGFSQGDPARCFKQLFYLYDQLGIKHFAFLDDALLVNKREAFLPFLRLLAASTINAHFYLPNAVHLEYIDRETATLMRQGGFKNIRLGLESSHSSFHARPEKTLDPGSTGQKVEILKAAGFHGREIGINILAGLPGQTLNELSESVRFARQFSTRVYLNEFSPVPHTPVWDECVKLSPYPLADEPLTHNNTILPLRSADWGFAEFNRLKQTVTAYNQGIE